MERGSLLAEVCFDSEECSIIGSAAKTSVSPSLLQEVWENGSGEEGDGQCGCVCEVQKRGEVMAGYLRKLLFGRRVPVPASERNNPPPESPSPPDRESVFPTEFAELVGKTHRTKFYSGGDQWAYYWSYGSSVNCVGVCGREFPCSPSAIVGLTEISHGDAVSRVMHVYYSRTYIDVVGRLHGPLKRNSTGGYFCPTTKLEWNCHGMSRVGPSFDFVRLAPDLSCPIQSYGVVSKENPWLRGTCYDYDSFVVISWNVGQRDFYSNGVPDTVDCDMDSQRFDYEAAAAKRIRDYSIKHDPTIVDSLGAPESLDQEIGVLEGVLRNDAIDQVDDFLENFPGVDDVKFTPLQNKLIEVWRAAVKHTRSYSGREEGY